jgi:16S rRNA (cytidine1402-2'-O)-methyltransferase
MSGKLYIVGTPIGNLGDLSPRVCEILSEVDFVAAEDTRNTRKLLTHLGLSKELISYFEHNKAMKGQYLIDRILSGESCAIVTDAGMPAISDPGEDIVRMCHEQGVDTIVIPGPCAAICALALSGLPSKRFAFEGFLSAAAGDRRSALSKLRTEERTMIFYEAPHRLRQTLDDMLELWGDRRVAIIKEITKIHETVWYTTLAQSGTLLSDQDIRGEFVLIAEGAVETVCQVSDEKIRSLLAERIESGMRKSDAVKQVAIEFDLPKNRVYKLSNDLE